LNSNDDFKESTIQKTWEQEGKNPETKKNYNYKLTCDSDDLIIFLMKTQRKKRHNEKIN